MPSLAWRVIRLERVRARYSSSWEEPSSRAYSITGSETVSPWLPLPELMTTGSSQPLMRASEPAAALALARILISVP